MKIAFPIAFKSNHPPTNMSPVHKPASIHQNRPAHPPKKFQIKIPIPPFIFARFFHKTTKQIQKNINILNSKKFF
jgi:hypothetical protein